MSTPYTASPCEKLASPPRRVESAAKGEDCETRRPQCLNSIPLGVWLILLAAVLFLVGILSPSVVVNEFGNTRQLSLLDGIQVLWATGHTFLAALIFLFTILFPPVKLVLTAAVAIPTLRLAQQTRRRFRKLVESLGRWSLLDVLVIAILIVAIKVRGLVSVKAAWGVYAFTCSIALSMLATHFLTGVRGNACPLLGSTVHATERPRRATALNAAALALVVLGIGWFFLSPAGTVNQIHVTRKDTFVELPRLFGHSSFYVRVRTLQGVQRLDTKSGTPIGNGLMWTLKQPVPSATIYELEFFQDGLLADKLVDRVTVSSRRLVGERFQFELKCRGDWQRPCSFITTIIGIIGFIFVRLRIRRLRTTCPAPGNQRGA